KMNYLANHYFSKDKDFLEKLKSYWHPKPESQKVFDEFSENTITNFYLPFSVAPNFEINNESYCIPMVIEESSVVAACSKAAKFWKSRGGFKAEVINTVKTGQVHFFWNGEYSKINNFFKDVKQNLISDLSPYLVNMESRGGGLLDLELLDFSHKEKNYFQIFAKFETCDAMGANFINTILELISSNFSQLISDNKCFSKEEREIDIIMSILSNYAPECLVRAKVECPIKDLDEQSLGMGHIEFAQKFEKAIRISKIDKYRAVTHNKGILNGIDSVVLATGNDFRAIEAGIHAYAVKNNDYRGLTNIKLENDIFEFSIDIPLTLGTVGGLTTLHPLAKVSLDLLGNPNAQDLMKIIACVGLAQNFSAIKSLVTTGIQKGHMKMHLMNILNHLKATDDELQQAKEYFVDKVVSQSTVRDYLLSIRSYH
ncbi:MAG: hydroxymethylglutaryl-CoA reductase, degradative, partial [Bdellovibrionales bacterium]|nr:hydroxymethylglutaryl-CoA reductase, degradative [Bdellovibrionales bacterium]